MVTVLRMRRVGQGLTQTELAAKTGLRSDWICRLENRKAVAPILHQQLLAEALRLPPDALFDENGLAREASSDAW